MPYHWSNPTPDQTKLTLWPHRSLPRRGFAGFIGLTSVLIAVPLIALIGSPLLWVLLPFLIIAVTALWIALEHSYKTGRIMETLTLSGDDHLTLTRSAHGKPDQHWQDNPYWVQVRIHPKGGPVDHYLTLKGVEREVEIGAFLSEKERKSLYHELQTRLRGA